MRLARQAALVLLLLPAQARAFDWLGLRSGMTQDQVRAAAPAGATLRLNGDFGFVEKGGETVATVTFCKGRLIGLSRTIDAQSDWFALADKMIRQYGAPKVTPTTDPWAGPKANVSKGLELSWRSGRNKYALTAYPPAQPALGKGPGQNSAKAPASLSVADLGPVNACVARHAAARAQPLKAGAVRRVTRLKRGKPRLPPIGGDKLNLTPPAAREVQAKAVPAPRPRSAATADSDARGAPVPIDPSSVRGRILRFFGYPRERFGSSESAEDR